MHWIRLKQFAIAALALGLAGCANQDTILPTPEREMIAIYRDVMNQVDAPTAPMFDPHTICASLVLQEPVADCQRKLAAHATAVYQHIDAVTPQQSLDYVQYTRSALTELDNLFPRHDNPDIVVYVYPHLATRSRAPIPGYTTVVPLYERVEYRLPGEITLETPSPDKGEGLSGDAL